MSKLASLKEWYTIPESIEYLQKIFEEVVLEKNIYEWAINNKIILSIILPQYTFIGITAYPASAHIKKLHNLDWDSNTEYSDDDFAEMNRSILINTILFTPTEEPKQSYISGLWDIAITEDDRKTEFITKIYNWLNNPSNHPWINMRRIELIAPQNNKCALLSRERYGENNQIMWSLDPLKANSATIIITKENLEAFIQSTNKASNRLKQKEKPLHSTEKENLLRIIGILLQKGHELEDLNPLTKNKIADLLIACRDELNLTEPAKTKITEIIQDAWDLIPKKSNNTN